MSLGHQVARAMSQAIRVTGGTVLIHKNWNTADQATTEARGLKTSEKNRPEEVLFLFLDDHDIQLGDVLQQKGARGLWKVVEIEDEVVDDVRVYVRVKVRNANDAPTRSSQPLGSSQVTVHGPVYGGLQVGSPHGNQHVSGTESSHPRFAVSGRIQKGSGWDNACDVFGVGLKVVGSLSAQNLMVDVHHPETNCPGGTVGVGWREGAPVGIFMSKNDRRMHYLSDSLNPEIVTGFLNIPVVPATPFPFQVTVEISARDMPPRRFLGTLNRQQMASGEVVLFTEVENPA